MKTHFGSCFLLAVALLFVASEGTITEVSPDELDDGIRSGFFRVVADVRTLAEFERGHIPNATLVESLASAGTAYEVTNASALWGCRTCNIAVYCRSGARANTALRYLARQGFENLFDAGGIGDWKASNRALVNTDSKGTPCNAPAPKSICEEPNPASEASPGVVTKITPDELAAGMSRGFFSVVADVRTLAEFNRGHIPNATLVESLALAGSMNEITNASDLLGCTNCNIAVYCRSGGRSFAASHYLSRNGFQSIYDAGGINQWQASKRALVLEGSKTPTCTMGPGETCEAGSEEEMVGIPPKKSRPLEETSKGDDSRAHKGASEQGGLDRKRLHTRRLRGI